MIRFKFTETKGFAVAPLGVLQLQRTFAEPREEWQALHAAADGKADELTALLEKMWKRGGKRMDIEDLERAIWQGDVQAIADLLKQASGTEGAAEAFAGILAEVTIEAGEAAVEFFPTPGAFTGVNPEAVAWAGTHAGDLIQGIGDDALAAVRQLVGRAFVDGIPPAEMARFIREIIGLDARRATALYNYRKGLELAGLSPGKIAQLVDKYAAKLLRDRALTIARTETIRAANMGQQLTWVGAAKEGLLDPKRVERVWIVTPDDRLCERCAGMGGKRVGLLDDPFVEMKGGVVIETVEVPPLHPRCRCAVGLKLN